MPQEKPSSPKKPAILIIEPYSLLHKIYPQLIGSDVETLAVDSLAPVADLLGSHPDLQLLVVNDLGDAALAELTRLIRRFQATSPIGKVLLLGPYEFERRTALLDISDRDRTFQEGEKTDLAKTVRRLLNLSPRPAG